jgi:hypothetical protein
MSASNKENKLPDKQEQLEFYRAKLLQMSIEYDDAADEGNVCRKRIPESTKSSRRRRCQNLRV